MTLYKFSETTRYTDVYWLSCLYWD